MRCPHIASQFINLAFLRRRATKETLEVLAGETGLCFECGGKLQEKDGELVCVGCGIVWGNGVFEDDRIPFEGRGQDKDFEAQWSPPSELAFNKNLGVNQWLSRASFCRILAPVNKEDLGLRSTYLKILTTKSEHPWIISLLNYGSHICKRFGLHRNDNACVRFANTYGGILRKLGAFIILQGKHWQELKKTARAAFIVLYWQFAGEAKAEEARQQLGVDDKFLSYVGFLVDALTHRHRKAKKRQR